MKAWVALLALASLAGAQTAVWYEHEPEWVRDAEPGANEWSVALVASEDRDAYLKVLPAPGNPAFDNGTVDGDGWWTEVLLDGHRLGATAEGTIELGRITAGEPLALTVRIHVPEAAFAGAHAYRLAYTFAVRDEAGNGSGGSLHPSVSFVPTLRVGEPGDPSAQADDPLGDPLPDEEDDAPAELDAVISSRDLPSWQGLVLLVLAILMGLGMAVAMEAARRARVQRQRALHMLLAVDHLLGRLPEDEVRAFMESPDAARYEDLLEEVKNG